MNPFLDVACSAAESASRVLLEYWENARANRVEEKSTYDLVSEADRKSEQVIRKTLLRAFPNHRVLGEEEGESGEGEMEWIIDPLDGTNNFVMGYPCWSISIGFRENRRMTVAAIRNPLTGDLFTAQAGRGAHLNGTPVRVREPGQAGRAFLATGFPFRRREHLSSYLNMFQRFFSISRGIRRAGSAALDLAFVGSGIFNGFFEYSLSLWDFAAGVLIIQEAGGKVTDFEGTDRFWETGNLLAGAPATHEAMLALLREKPLNF